MTDCKAQRDLRKFFRSVQMKMMEVPQDFDNFLLASHDDGDDYLAYPTLRCHYLYGADREKIWRRINFKKFKYFGYCNVSSDTVDSLMEIFNEALIWDYGYDYLKVKSLQPFKGRTISTFLCYTVPGKDYYHACLIVGNKFI